MVKRCDKCFTKYDDVNGEHECPQKPEVVIPVKEPKEEPEKKNA